MRPVKKFDIRGASCVSAGVIFFRYRNGRLEFLMQHKPDKKQKWWFEDLGGKVDLGDSSPNETAAREADEESNGQISKIYTMELMRQNSIALLYQKAQYMMYLVHLPDEKDFEFGDHEVHPKYFIQRTLKWIPIDVIQKIPFSSIHPRIRHFYRMIKLF